MALRSFTCRVKNENIEGIIAIAPHIFVEKITVDSIKTLNILIIKQTLKILESFIKTQKLLNVGLICG